MSKRDYFFIELAMLKDEEIFPFNLHVFNPINNRYNIFLYANSPLTEEKKLFLEFIIEKSGRIAISMDQKETFLHATESKEEDIPDLKDEGPHDLEISHQENVLKLEQLQKEKGSLKFNQELKSISDNDDFSNLIEHTRLEIMTFSPRISHTVSLAIYLADSYLIEDNFVNRVVALSFQMGKSCGYKDEGALGDMVVAAFFSHLGHTQVNLEYTRTPFLELNSEAKKDLKKHPGLSQHLIRKSGIELSNRCQKIIAEHHERVDGSGFPAQKTGDHIEPMALVLGVSLHILEFTGGKITPDKKTLKSMVHSIKNKSYIPGLEFEFGQVIMENLEYMFGENLEKSDFAA